MKSLECVENLQSVLKCYRDTFRKTFMKMKTLIYFKSTMLKFD